LPQGASPECFADCSRLCVVHPSGQSADQGSRDGHNGLIDHALQHPDAAKLP
jgi:hypothetical protein